MNYRRLAGIKQLEPGYKKVEIAPELTENLTHVGLKHKTPYGWLEAHWKKTDNGLVYDLNIPHSTEAVLQQGDKKLQIGSGCWKINEEGVIAQ